MPTIKPALAIGIVTALWLSIAGVATAAPIVTETAGVRYTFSDQVITAKHTRRGLRVARQYWAPTPSPATCANGITWKRLIVEPIALEIMIGPPPTPMGADAASCTIWAYRPFLASKSVAMVCTAIVHEYGHLLGLEHEETGIMAAEQSKALPACKTPKRHRR